MTGPPGGNPLVMENEPGDTTPERDPEERGLMEKIVDKARGTGVGTEDPNIVGDVGPTDVPPGKDADSGRPPPDPEETASAR